MMLRSLRCISGPSALLTSALLVFSPVLNAQTPAVDTPQTAAPAAPAAPAAFAPFALEGDWQFISTNSGRRYGGAVRVAINMADTAGKMSGTLSYDGTQTNDNCSTRGAFSDSPVPAQITRTEQGYTIDFEMKCARGTSPRAFSWVLNCASGVCERRETASHGGGVTRLTEKR